MKIWIDDVRQPPSDEYIWCKSTNEALRTIVLKHKSEVELICLDHDAGDFAREGGDFINVLRELERLARKKTVVDGVAFHGYWHQRCKELKFRLHSMNPVGVQNMRAIIQRNDWTEIR